MFADNGDTSHGSAENSAWKLNPHSEVLESGFFTIPTSGLVKVSGDAIRSCWQQEDVLL